MDSAAYFDSRAERSRFGAALAIGLLLWLAILYVFSRLLSPQADQTPQLPPVDAKIIELPALKPLPQPSVPPAPRVERQPPKPIAKPHPKEHVVPHPKPTPVPQVTQPADKTAAQADNAKAAAVPETPLPKPTPQPDTNASPAGTARMGAKAIYQPVPKIPDDLRDEAISLVAVARFHIKPDGSADVELIKATSSPRINQLILNTLRTWKFFPALQEGKPVASVQDIKVRIDVD